MKFNLMVRHKCEGEGGHILIRRVDAQETLEIGEVKFNDEGEKRWLLAVLMERHPHVTLSDENVPCDGTPITDGQPC